MEVSGRRIGKVTISEWYFIDTENYEYEKAVALTNEALEREYVIIYEVALWWMDIYPNRYFRKKEEISSI